MCMGIPEGRGKKQMVPIKISGPDRDILFSKYFSFGVKFSFSSLTSKPRELDRFRPYVHAYCYLTLVRLCQNF
jgi:hypothetical protein